MSKDLYAGTCRLARFILRRDRIRIPVWLISILVFTIAVAAALPQIAPTPEERMVMAETMSNPAITAMMGPNFGIEEYTFGAMYSHYMLLWLAMAAGIMNIFLVVRHTRKDEEEGRIEMIRSLPVGRLSNLCATLIVVVVINIFLALASGLGLAVLRIESIDLQGSFLFGAAMGVTGLLFGAITAVFVQLSSSARGAMGSAFGILGLAYLIRAGADGNNEAAACISPLGLILRTEAYVNNYWWPVFAAFILTVVVGALAFYLNHLRDLGEGLIPATPGRSTASSFLQNAFGLAFRLIRNMIIGWAVVIFVFAAAYGSILGDLDTFLAGNDFLSAIMSEDSSFSFTEQFITVLMSIMCILSAIPSISAILKIRNEEVRGRIEHVYGRAVSRWKMLGSYFSISFISGALMCLLNTLGFWAAGSVVMEEPISFGIFMQASFVYLPAIWVMIGLAVFLTGICPKRTVLVWVYLLFSFLAVYMGKLLSMPDWMMKLSPYGHIPALPVEEMNWVVMVVLSLIAAVLAILGFLGYKKRDITG